MRLRALSASLTGLPLPAWRLLLAVAAACWLLVASVAAQAGQPAAATHTVTMRQMHFEPAQMTVNPGDTIEWTNEDIFAHTATANDGSFDSGLIPPGQSWKTVVKSSGTVDYHCRPHPNMAARLVVASATAEGKQQGVPVQHEHGGDTTLKWMPPTRPEQIHPILVNFTAALLPLALLSDILGRIFRRQTLHNAAWWMVLYAAAITPLTAVAGWWWKHNAGADLPVRLITVHQWLGTTAVVLFLVLAVWRWNIQKRGVPPSTAYLACALIAVLALVYQGSLGGAMVFGQ
jgi:plastocyanin/uncharacterized membrane protein